MLERQSVVLMGLSYVSCMMPYDAAMAWWSISSMQPPCCVRRGRSIFLYICISWHIMAPFLHGLFGCYR